MGESRFGEGGGEILAFVSLLMESLSDMFLYVTSQCWSSQGATFIQLLPPWSCFKIKYPSGKWPHTKKERSLTLFLEKFFL